MKNNIFNGGYTNFETESCIIIPPLASIHFFSASSGGIIIKCQHAHSKIPKYKIFDLKVIQINLIIIKGGGGNNWVQWYTVLRRLRQEDNSKFKAILG